MRTPNDYISASPAVTTPLQRQHWPASTCGIDEYEEGRESAPLFHAFLRYAFDRAIPGRGSGGGGNRFGLATRPCEFVTVGGLGIRFVGLFFSFVFFWVFLL